MAYGDIMMQPGYRSPTQSMIGPYQRPASSYRVPVAGGSKRLVEGVGFPSYGAAAQPKTGGGGPATISMPSISPVSANLNIPQAQPYQAQTYSDPNLGYMAQQAKGLMDPDSDYYKRLSMGMQGQIGQQSAAQQRAAALRGAWSGLGGGASPEMMSTQADISQAGLEAQGQAEAGLRLQAPQLGMQGLQSTFGPQLGYKQLTEGGRQFGAGMGEQARQYGGNLALQQQQLASQQALAGAGMGMQANMFNAQAQNQYNMQQAAQQHQLMMQQLAMAYA